MTRADLIALGALLVLVVSMLSTPAGGVGVDGRWILAGILIAVLARPHTTKES